MLNFALELVSLMLFLCLQCTRWVVWRICRQLMRHWRAWSFKWRRSRTGCTRKPRPFQKPKYVTSKIFSSFSHLEAWTFKIKVRNKVFLVLLIWILLEIFWLSWDRCDDFRNWLPNRCGSRRNYRVCLFMHPHICLKELQPWIWTLIEGN